MYPWIYIALGSGLGGAARFAVSSLVDSRIDTGFPWGTLTVNVVGSFLVGLVAMLTNPESGGVLPPTLRPFLMVGFFGGFTTFSSFSLQTLNLIDNGDWAAVGLNVGLSVFLCLTGVWLGTLAGKAMTAG